MSLFIRVLVLLLLVSPQAFAKNSGSSGSRVVTATSKTNPSKVTNTPSPSVRSTIRSKKSNSQQIRSNADEKGAQNSDEQKKNAADHRRGEKDSIQKPLDQINEISRGTTPQ